MTDKQKNIIDMAYGFSAMGRVFEKGAREKILVFLCESMNTLDSVTTGAEYRAIHDSFCARAMENIKTAKGSNNPSYGQVAKVFDMAAKVYIYYCKYPTPEKAEALSKMLYAAIDTKILKYLKKMPSDHHIEAMRISDITEPIYRELQALVVQESAAGNMIPVEWDDKKWRELNRPLSDK